MLYMRLNESIEVVELASDRKAVMAICNASDTGAQWARQPIGGKWNERYTNGQIGAGWLNRNDIESFEFAQRLAASASKLGKRDYLATDEGTCCSPRYDVIEAPMVGDEVSYGFNGDYYPDGKITKVSESYNTITTSTGSTYRRRGDTGCWKKPGGTWSLVRGHVNERNPSF